MFLQKTVNDPRFPRLSERVHQYKNTEKGAAEMCEELERYIDDYIDEITAELQASNSEKDKALSEKDKEIARLNELVASLSKNNSRPANS